LREYRRLNLSETELIILLRLLFLRQSHQALYPGDVAAEFCCSVEEAQALLSPFIDSGLVDDYEQGAFYQLDGLYRQLYEQWMDCQREQCKASGKKTLKSDKKEPALGGAVYHSFEREMGRSLTFKENQQIREWLDKDEINEELVDEALRRAVLQGVMQGNAPLAYIDKILLNWKKQKLSSLAAVLALDKPPERQAKPTGKGRSQKAAAAGDDYSEVYK
ncbi:MAG: DnaD domain protein, partial [Clostridiales bacterium]